MKLLRFIDMMVIDRRSLAIEIEVRRNIDNVLLWSGNIDDYLNYAEGVLRYKVIQFDCFSNGELCSIYVK